MKACAICLRDLEHAADAMEIKQRGVWICPKTTWIDCARIEQERFAARPRKNAA